MEDYQKIKAKSNPSIILRVYPGHFVTPNSHINYYVDMTDMKSRQSEATAVAEAISQFYLSSSVIDTILCMDGCEVIGADLADNLTRAGIISMNAHKTIYVMTPEISSAGQMIFRENIRHMVKGKHVLVLFASATTGRTIASAVNTVRYYGGEITGVSAIFSALSEVDGITITRLYGPEDLDGYESYPHAGCKLCERNIPIDAICNSYGFSRV
ncbi:MAG: phosphoribosyltransferase [Lachnospiraceae bacterium]|nr:phosphoribosyltransferase [Lachnospiraceae bacterium]